jgi:hypothetical protein
MLKPSDSPFDPSAEIPQATALKRNSNEKTPKQIVGDTRDSAASVLLRRERPDETASNPHLQKPRPGEVGPKEETSEKPDPSDVQLPARGHEVGKVGIEKAASEDLLHRKILDTATYGAPAIFLGLGASIASIETVANYGYLVSNFLLERFPQGVLTANGTWSVSSVFAIKNAIVFASFIAISGLFAKFVSRNTVRKNPYIQTVGPSIRLESSPFAKSGELHFYADKSFYEEAARAADTDRFIALNLLRNIEKSIATFANEGYSKRLGGSEPIPEIVIHSPLLTSGRAASLERIISKYPNLECSARPERLPVWKERAAELLCKNLPFPLLGTWFKNFPKSRDFIFKGGGNDAWIGPKGRANVLTTIGLLQGLSRLPAEMFRKLGGRPDEREMPEYCRMSVRYRPAATEERTPKL